MLSKNQQRERRNLVTRGVYFGHPFISACKVALKRGGVVFYHLTKNYDGYAGFDGFSYSYIFFVTDVTDKRLFCIAFLFSR